MLSQVSATRVEISGSDTDLEKIQKQLQYQDLKVDFEISKHKKAYWYVNKFGQEQWQEKLDELKASRTKSLFFQEKDGTFWTYSGLTKNLLKSLPHISFKNTTKYPEPKSIPWHKQPTKIPRPYQKEIISRLIEARHGGVEAATGCGKTLCIMLLTKHYGLKTVVMTPSISIAKQMHKEFLHHFGPKYVGKYGDGKKEYKKLFTVAISASLANLEPEDEAWKELSKASVFIADESHLCPAQTLARVCFGVLAEAPYRFFFSGTQMRGDGLDLLLEAITGDIVFRFTVQEGVDQGYLARPRFQMFSLRSDSVSQSDDPNAMTREHLFYSPRVNKLAASIANRVVSEMGRSVLILIEEMEQFSCLLPYLRHSVRFAHGGCTKENRDKVPKEYQDKPDVAELVEAYNAGEFPILIGTSCVGTGTDFQGVGVVIYLQGGKPEVQIKQSVGRGTRLVEGKTDFFFIDFDVYDCHTTHRHAVARREIYEEIYPDSIQEIRP